MIDKLLNLEIEGTYKIKTLLGQGGMSLVFSAHDQALHRQVAVKIIKPEYASSPEIIQDFLKEARIVANLKHPYIVSVYDQGTLTIDGQGLIYIVMRYAAGGTLTDRLKAGPLPLEQVKQILEQTCQALDYAHSQNVIHLDLKPLNILFDAQGNVLVADFGLAKLLKATSQVKGTTGAGTPAYMAPEQFLGSQVGAYTDTYALGLVLHEMLTGEMPERDWTSEGLTVQIKNTLPQGIQSIIQRATEQEYQQRYRRAGDLVLDFIRTQHISEPTLPFGSKPESGDQKPAKSRIRVPSVIGIGVFLLLALLGISLFLINMQQPGEDVSVAQAMPTAPPSHTPTTTPIPPTDTPTATQPPTASATLTAVPPTALPSPTLYVRIITEQFVRAGPGKEYEVLGEVQRGYQLPLLGRLPDSTWWEIDYLSWPGWIPAQPGGLSIDPTLLPTAPTPPAPAFTLTFTPEPTASPAPTRTPAPTAAWTSTLQNPGFERISDNHIPGWKYQAFDNFADGGDYDPNESFETPLFKQADDSLRWISGPTLQIDAAGHLKFRAYVFQTVSVPPGARVQFQASARAYSDVDRVKLGAGIDPNGNDGCARSSWGSITTINQSNGIVKLTTPQVTAGPTGRVTVCLLAETLYPAINNAAFFDNAQLFVNSD